MVRLGPKNIIWAGLGTPTVHLSFTDSNGAASAANFNMASIGGVSTTGPFTFKATVYAKGLTQLQVQIGSVTTGTGFATISAIT